MKLNVNVHASTLARDFGFPAFLLERASEARIAPERLVVEIVEHAPPLDVPGFRRALEELREGGLTIALDDVGLGQSNYKMILDVRPDIYKLDRYLVAGAWNDPYRQVILDSLARMVRRLEARAVAEGVEDQNELVAVEAAGIDLVQGFLFARPLPRHELAGGGLPRRPHAPGRRPVKRRLLLLDDDAAIVSVVRRYFEGKGFEVESCLAAAEALRIVESDAPFDAIVCDLHFTPARLSEGLEIVERARRKRPGSALLLFTGAGGAGRAGRSPAARRRRGGHEAHAARELARRGHPCDEEHRESQRLRRRPAPARDPAGGLLLPEDRPPDRARRRGRRGGRVRRRAASSPATPGTSRRCPRPTPPPGPPASAWCASGSPRRSSGSCACARASSPST